MMFLLTLSLLSMPVYADEIENSSDIVQVTHNAAAHRQDYYYEIEPESSTIKFRADSPVGDVWAKFEAFKGHFTISRSEASDETAVVQIDAGSLTTDAGFIESVLKSSIFFDVDTFPSMKFVGTSLEWYNKKNAVLKGKLTIHNVTREVAFYVHLVDNQNESDLISVNVTTTIRRSEFNISSLLPAVGDDVNLYMDINARKRPVNLSLNDE